MPAGAHPSLTTALEALRVKHGLSMAEVSRRADKHATAYSAAIRHGNLTEQSAREWAEVIAGGPVEMQVAITTSPAQAT